MKLLKNSDVFGERMDEVNERIKKKLDSEEWDKKKPKFDYNFSVDTLEGSSRRSNRPKGGARPNRKKKETGSWSFQSREKKKNEKREKKAEPETPEPLVDLFESDSGLRVVAMFPEVEGKDELKLEIGEEKLVLKTNEYEEELELPFPVEEEPEVRFKNGIFDIQFTEKRE